VAKKETENEVKEEKKRGKVLKIIGIIFLILLILVIAIGTIGIHYVNSKLDKIDYEELPPEEIEVNAGVEEQLETYRNIALLGLDARADTFDGTRSDCIMIVSINQKTNEVRLLSVYRDTYLELTDRSLDKITHAYAYGGPKLTLSTLNTNLDLNITEYVTVNFETVRTVVNAIGGIIAYHKLSKNAIAISHQLPSKICINLRLPSLSNFSKYLATNIKIAIYPNETIIPNILFIIFIFPLS